MHEVPAQYVLSPCAPAPRTLVDILYDTAARYPEATAIDDGDVQLTYSELISDIEDSVEWLAARGIGRGDRIGIRMPSGSYALYVAILATLATEFCQRIVSGAKLFAVAMFKEDPLPDS